MKIKKIPSLAWIVPVIAIIAGFAIYQAIYRGNVAPKPPVKSTIIDKER